MRVFSLVCCGFSVRASRHTRLACGESALAENSSGRQSLDQSVNLFPRVVKMGRDSQPTQPGRGDNTTIVQKMIEFPG
jgi:hypothetical protein